MVQLWRQVSIATPMSPPYFTPMSHLVLIYFTRLGCWSPTPILSYYLSPSGFSPSVTHPPLPPPPPSTHDPALLMRALARQGLCGLAVCARTGEQVSGLGAGLLRGMSSTVRGAGIRLFCHGYHPPFSSTLSSQLYHTKTGILPSHFLKFHLP